MKSDIIKRSVVVFGHKTSISMEESFWQALKEIAAAKHMTVTSIVGDISANQRTNSNLSSMIRQYVLQYFYELATGGRSSPESSHPHMPLSRLPETSHQNGP